MLQGNVTAPQVESNPGVQEDSVKAETGNSNRDPSAEQFGAEELGAGNSNREPSAEQIRTEEPGAENSSREPSAEQFGAEELGAGKSRREPSAEQTGAADGTEAPEGESKIGQDDASLKAQNIAPPQGTGAAAGKGGDGTAKASELQERKIESKAEETQEETLAEETTTTPPPHNLIAGNDGTATPNDRASERNETAEAKESKSELFGGGPADPVKPQTAAQRLEDEMYMAAMKKQERAERLNRERVKIAKLRKEMEAGGDPFDDVIEDDTIETKPTASRIISPERKLQESWNSAKQQRKADERKRKLERIKQRQASQPNVHEGDATVADEGDATVADEGDQEYDEDLNTFEELSEPSDNEPTNEPGEPEEQPPKVAIPPKRGRKRRVAKSKRKKPRATFPKKKTVQQVQRDTDERFLHSLVVQQEQAETQLGLKEEHNKALADLANARNAVEKSARKIREKDYALAQTNAWEQMLVEEQKMSSQAPSAPKPRPNSSRGLRRRRNDAGVTRMQARRVKRPASAGASTRRPRPAARAPSSDAGPARETAVTPRAEGKPKSPFSRSPRSRKRRKQRPMSAPAKSRSKHKPVANRIPENPLNAGRPTIPPPVDVPARPHTAGALRGRRGRDPSYTTSVLELHKQQLVPWRRTLRIGRRDSKREHAPTQSDGRATDWTGTLSSPPSTLFNTANCSPLVPRRPQSRRKRRPRSRLGTASPLQKSRGELSVGAKIDSFEQNRVGRRLRTPGRMSATEERGGRQRPECVLKPVFPDHPKVEAARSRLMVNMEADGRLSKKVEDAAHALCTIYNSTVMGYLAGKMNAGEPIKGHGGGAGGEGMTEDEVAREMVGRALKLTEPKSFFTNAEGVRVGLRSTTLNNAACYHSACGRPRMALKALWEARMLSWGPFSDSATKGRPLDAPEVRTILNMSSLYNKMGDYEKSLKLLRSVCAKLRKKAPGKRAASEKQTSKKKVGDLLPLALYTLGCTHEHLLQWQLATRTFREGYEYARQLFGEKHTLALQLANAYEDARDHFEKLQKERAERRAKMKSRKQLERSLYHTF